MIEREKSFVLKGVKLTAKFPNVGQLIDMESLKVALTGGRYGALSASGCKSMYVALDLVDAISFFSILVPQVKNMFSKELTSLTTEEGKELVDIFKKDIRPWYNEIEKQLYEGDKSTSETKSE